MTPPSATYRRLLALAGCLVAFVAAGCGSDEEPQDSGTPIPAAQASALQQQLDSIQSRYDVGGGACGDITGGDDPNTAAVDQILGSIPRRVSADVRSALDDSFARLFQLVREQCDEEKGTATERVETAPPETTPPETTPPETETVPPPETTPTQTAPPATTPEPGNQGNGVGNGQGNGNGNGPPEDPGNSEGGGVAPGDEQ